MPSSTCNSYLYFNNCCQRHHYDVRLLNVIANKTYPSPLLTLGYNKCVHIIINTADGGGRGGVTQKGSSIILIVLNSPLYRAGIKCFL